MTDIDGDTTSPAAGLATDGLPDAASGDDELGDFDDDLPGPPSDDDVTDVERYKTVQRDEAEAEQLSVLTPTTVRCQRLRGRLPLHLLPRQRR